MTNVEFKLSQANAHPNAQQLLKDEFYWDPTEEAGPFGSDNGSDAFYAFIQWRKRNQDTPPFEFVKDIITRWGFLNDHYEETDPEKIAELVKKDSYGIMARDNALIAVCFGQFVLEGQVDPEMKILAMIALQRQKDPQVSTLFAPDYHQQRLEILNKMIDDLKKV